MYKLRMIVLTKSFKPGGYCLAGINSQTGQWMRLVTLNGGAIPMEYCNGFDLLDEIEVVVLDDAPTAVQPENKLLDMTDYARVLRQTVSWQEVVKLHPLEMCNEIFDRWYGYISANDYHNPGYSLMLICVSNLTIRKREGDTRTWAEFEYCCKRYRAYRVTDPKYYHQVKPVYYDKAILVVSIGEALKLANNEKSLHYKFVAAIYSTNN